MKGSMPSWAVREAGAPAEVWMDIQAPEDSDSLYLDVIWVNKTATRLPEVTQWAWGLPVSACIWGKGGGWGWLEKGLGVAKKEACWGSRVRRGLAEVSRWHLYPGGGGGGRGYH